MTEVLFEGCDRESARRTYLPIISVSRLRRSPGRFPARVVTAAVCGITETENRVSVTSTTVTEPTVVPTASVAPVSGTERTFRVPHPVLSAISWLIAAASAAWLVILGVSLALNVASGVSHDSEFMMLTYGVYMACAFGFCCFGTFFALHFGLGSSAHWRDSIRHPNHPH